VDEADEAVAILEAEFADDRGYMPEATSSKVQTTPATLLAKSLPSGPPAKAASMAADGAAEAAAAALQQQQQALAAAQQQLQQQQQALLAAQQAVALAGGPGAAAGGAGVAAPPAIAPQAQLTAGALLAAGGAMPQQIGGAAAAAAAGPAHGNANEDLRTLVLQLVNRVKALESQAYDVVILPTAHPVPVETESSLLVWKAAVGANPNGHGLGGAEGLMAVGLLRGIVQRGVPANSDAGIRARLAALIYLLVNLLDMPPLDTTLFFKHCVIARLQGNRAGSSVLVVGVEGRLSLPTGQQVDEAINNIEAAIRDKNYQALKAESHRCFS